MANTPYLAGHISKLEIIPEVSVGEINATVQPTVLFSHPYELEIKELADADTNPTKNLQDNVAILLFGTQTSSPYSPLEKNLVNSA